MSKYVTKIVAVFAILALSGISALADTRSDRITFDEGFQIDGTTVKKGEYRVSFDEETGELTIKKNDKLVAKTTARAEKSEGRADRTKFSMATENGNKMLRSVTFSGDDHVVVIGATGSSTTGVTK
jgi:hypothetical protein